MNGKKLASSSGDIHTMLWGVGCLLERETKGNHSFTHFGGPNPCFDTYPVGKDSGFFTGPGTFFRLHSQDLPCHTVVVMKGEDNSATLQAHYRLRQISFGFSVRRTF